MRAADTDSAQTLIEPLTRRESQMLVLLAEGYSRPEIATQLTLALTSVKFHIQHLYGKLGVNSKRQALVRANELGLLVPGSSAMLAARPGASAARKHNLPMQVTRFFGREAEIAQLRDLLDDNRLVTLTGSGGVGKTRLSLRVAEEALTEFRDGVCFVDLAPLADPELAPRQAAFSFGLREEPGRSSLETLIGFLGQRQALMVLDNCEHLTDACARLADSLLRACPALKILATSREPLGARGEALFRVPSLPFPDPAQAISPERLDDFPSVRLFVDRARLVLPGYQVAPHNAEAVAGICQRLDGIPLALELAAARVKLLTAEQLAARLDDTLRLLTGGGRTALPRQQTLRATLEWSYALLADTERLLLQRLSVFAGSCTLGAAEAICAGEGVPASAMLDHVTALVDKSLVLADRQPGQETRYRLLEMVRQYGVEKLAASGADALLRSRHRDYFVEYVTSGMDNVNSAKEAPWAAALAADLDNVRCALEWSFRDMGAAPAGPRLVLGMSYLWPFIQEDLEWCQRAIALCEARPAIPRGLYINLLAHGAHLVSSVDLPTAVAWSELAVELSRGLGPDGQELLMQALSDLAWTYFDILGDFERAAAAYTESEAIFEALGPAAFPADKFVTHAAHFAQANARLASWQGRYPDAKRLAAESLRLYRQVGSPNGVDPLIVLGAACVELAEYDLAHEYFLEALREIEALATSWALNRQNSALRWLGLAGLKAGRLDRALEYSQAGLSLAAELADHVIVADCLALLAILAAKQMLPARAARLSGASRALYAAKRRQPRVEASLDTLLPGWETSSEAAALAQAFAAGQAMPAETAVAYALDEAVD